MQNYIDLSKLYFHKKHHNFHFLHNSFVLSKIKRNFAE